jgi:hypothetical protein
VYNTEQKPPPDFVDQVAAGVDWDYGDGAPREGLPQDRWTAVHYGTWTGPFQGIRVRCDDGCRVVVNDVVEWDGVAYSTKELAVTHLEPGSVPLRVEHHDETGNAYVRVEFLRPPAP